MYPPGVVKIVPSELLRLCDGHIHICTRGTTPEAERLSACPPRSSPAMSAPYPQTPRQAIPQLLQYQPRTTAFGKSAATRAQLSHHHSNRTAANLTLDAANQQAATSSLPYIRQPTGAVRASPYGRKYNITSILEENKESETHRRRHYWPASQALLQGYDHPPRSGEYSSARELREDRTKHVRPSLEPFQKFGATTAPPVSSMAYGWRVDASSSARQAGYSGRVCSPMTRYVEKMIKGPR
eukprot:SAG22_NODE_1897_length_3356_cov_3.577832_1_plen_240_part_00